MLTQFSVTNFQCIKEKATLDMRAIKLSEFKDTLINDRLLPVAAIYGPNGGGKSTLLRALFTLQRLVVKQFLSVKGTGPISDIKMSDTSVVPFKFAPESANKPTEFELFIEIEGIEYKYYMSIFDNKIVDESLYFKKVESKVIKEVFSRHKNEITLGAVIKNEVKLVDNIADEVPLFAWIGLVYKVDIIEKLKIWFLDAFCIDYNMPFQDELLVKLIFQMDIKNDEYTKNMKRKILDVLRSMDLNIASFKAERISEKSDIKISTKHIIDGKEYELDLHEESNGTKKIFGMLPLFLIVLDEGGTMIVDELDAKLHPQLLKYIISLFTNKGTNPKGAQLIFTSHDLTTMTKEVFRRDEIWFMAMGEQEYSNLYSLIDIRTEDGELVRPDAVYNKQYIEGRYGADPYLNVIKHWEM